MRGRLRVVLAATASLAAPASAATLTVTITGLADTGYELNVSGILKNGRLGAASGPATVRDLIDVGARETVKAAVTFLGRGGVIAKCPAVEVKLTRSQPACDPAFVLTGRQTGTDAYACETRCNPKKRVEKSGSDDEDDDDWVYAMASSQSFYTRAMSSARERGVYSPAERPTR